MNPSKQKGTAYETAVAEWFSDRGFPTHRRASTGANDQGDLRIAGMAATVECKNHKAINLAGWVDELVVERRNAAAKIGVLAIKRRGRNAGGSYFVVDAETLIVLLDCYDRANRR